VLKQDATEAPQSCGIWKTATDPVPSAHFLDSNGAKMTVDAHRTHYQVSVPDAFLELTLPTARPAVVATEFTTRLFHQALVMGLKAIDPPTIAIRFPFRQHRAWQGQVSQLRVLLKVILPMKQPSLETLIEQVIWIQNRNHRARMSHRKKCVLQVLKIP
jgi:hypothetical protein